MLRLTGGHQGKHVEKKHTDINIMAFTVTPLLDLQHWLAVIIDTLVRLNARAA